MKIVNKSVNDKFHFSEKILKLSNFDINTAILNYVENKGYVVNSCIQFEIKGDDVTASIGILKD